MKLYWNRIRLFSAIVYRPFDTTVWQETPFPTKLKTLISAPLAWDVACSVWSES